MTNYEVIDNQYGGKTLIIEGYGRTYYFNDEDLKWLDLGGKPKRSQGGRFLVMPFGHKDKESVYGAAFYENWYDYTAEPPEEYYEQEALREQLTAEQRVAYIKTIFEKSESDTATTFSHEDIMGILNNILNPVEKVPATVTTTKPAAVVKPTNNKADDPFGFVGYEVDCIMTEHACEKALEKCYHEYEQGPTLTPFKFLKYLGRGPKTGSFEYMVMSSRYEQPMPIRMHLDGWRPIVATVLHFSEVKGNIDDLFEYHN